MGLSEQVVHFARQRESAIKKLSLFSPQSVGY